MKKRTLIITIVLSFILIIGAAACRHGQRGVIDKFTLEAASRRISYQLDLNEFQKVQLENIIAEVVNEAEKMRADHESRRQEVVNLVLQETIDRESVDRMVAERFDRIQTMIDLFADRLIDFHATLTPEQREKAAEQIQELADKRHGMFRL